VECTVQIDYGEKVGDINPLLYGGGFEPLGGAVKLGLDAQMLEGESFEEEDVNQDGISDKWLPVSNGNHIARYSRDGCNAFNGFYSQKIEILQYKNGERGIKQGGLSLTKGAKYFASLHLRQKGMGKGSSVMVYLRRGKRIYARQTLTEIPPEWKRFVLSLMADDSDSRGEFWITLKGKGALWIDQVCLVPEKTYGGHGTRRDIMEAVVSIQPVFIRWPGGWFSENYRWKAGIGPIDLRCPTRKYYSSVRAKNDPSWESNRFGTDEFIQFCLDIGAIPLLTINIGYEEGRQFGEYLEEAADWVEYCNGGTETKFGALREANGHREPYGVTYWEIGNEPWEMGADNYARLFIQFAQTLKEKDQNIKLIAAGGNGYNREWNKKVIQIAGKYMDYLDLHYYCGTTNYWEAMSEPLKYEAFLNELKTYMVSHKQNVKLAILEWNSNINLKDASRLKEGLYAASFFNLLERQNGLVALSSPWPLLRRVQPFHNHLSDHGLIRFDNQRVYFSATALVFQLYRRNYAPERLNCKLRNCPSFVTEKGSEIPSLEVVATGNREEGYLVLKVVNRDPRKAIRSKIFIEGLGTSKLNGFASILNSTSVNARNSINHPDLVKIESEEIEIEGGNILHNFPAHSVTAIKLMTKPRFQKLAKKGAKKDALWV
jgi:alpha-N-arabinofuranosidase